MLNVQIRGHIGGIVVVYKSVLQHGVVERQSAEEEQEPDQMYGCLLLRHYYFLAGRGGTGIVLTWCLQTLCPTRLFSRGACLQLLQPSTQQHQVVVQQRRPREIDVQKLMK